MRDELLAGEKRPHRCGLGVIVEALFLGVVIFGVVPLLIVALGGR